ncbi:MAG: ABC transporter permease [Clostridium sp.]|nr:ABC transporter permease [Clostridium sp.]
MGFQIFPRVIITVYSSMYETPYVLAPFHWDLALISTAIAVFTTVIATLYATMSELRETPAILMQPKAPKPGKRIFLERIKPLWRRLSFSYKVTFRNIFRYKKRFLMTVIGISGCSALLVTGFGISDSVNAIQYEQFEEIFIYDGMVILNEESDASVRNLDEILGENPEVENFMDVHNESITMFKTGSSREYEVNLIVPDEVSRFRNFYDLHERVGNENIELTDEGAVITEKVADLLGVSVGDTLSYKDTDNRIYEFKISGIAENYLQHYMYMSKEYFDTVTLRAPVLNAGLFTLNNPIEIDGSQFTESLISNDGVIGAFLVSTIQDEFGRSLESLDYVVYILILAAGAMAFVVLYNLTNINITERIREIATIKVLGFRDLEVSAYVYRENMFLTMIGTLGGLLLGLLLHGFVMNTMEIDSMMFGKIISFTSYLYSIVITMAFAIAVNFFMHFRLKKVDMAASLKSVE